MRVGELSGYKYRHVKGSLGWDGLGTGRNRPESPKGVGTSPSTARKTVMRVEHRPVGPIGSYYEDLEPVIRW